MDPVLVIAAVAAVALVVVVVSALVRWRKRRVLIARYGAAAVGSRRRPMRVRERLPVVLMVAGFACAVIAFAQTRIERQSTQGTVILTMDVSKSMQRTDVTPNRLVAAQDAAEAFLSRLPGDFQVGVVTFADKATLAVEPTKDREEAGAALEIDRVVARDRDRGRVDGLPRRDRVHMGPGRPRTGGDRAPVRRA